ncbi:MAG TPA: hypothetical protein DCX10_11165, partial [Verrucomicrobiales bacterium]|nr:hypothetical protein [Verrucomicrobiales bacterium]
ILSLKSLSISAKPSLDIATDSAVAKGMLDGLCIGLADAPKTTMPKSSEAMMQRGGVLNIDELSILDISFLLTFSFMRIHGLSFIRNF